MASELNSAKGRFREMDMDARGSHFGQPDEIHTMRVNDHAQ
jgi:hypothetical protein